MQNRGRTLGALCRACVAHMYYPLPSPPPQGGREHTEIAAWTDSIHGSADFAAAAIGLRSAIVKCRRNDADGNRREGPHMLSRRNFLNGTIVAGAGLALAAQSQTAAQTPAVQGGQKRMIVDSQVHLWLPETP